MTIQSVEKAKGVQNKIEIRIDRVEREIEQASKSAAVDVSALAEGGAIDSGPITSLQAELRVLEKALESAKESVRTAQRVEDAREVIKRFDTVTVLLETRMQLAGEISSRLDEVAELLLELHGNSHEIIPKLRRLKGEDKPGPKGYIALGGRDLLQHDHLAHLLQIHMKRRVPIWKYELYPPHGGAPFGEAVRDASSIVLQELDMLVGYSDLLDEDVKAIRAESSSQVLEA